MAKELKRLKVPDKFPHISPGADATTQTFENHEGNQVCIVCFYDFKKHCLEQNYAMIVHEAVHVWQKIRSVINEDSPSLEFESYSIQKICQELFIEFRRQTSKRKSK